MKLRDNRALGILLASVVLVGGANLAVYAANGKPLLLGQKNTATKTTTVANTGKGTPLTLQGKKSEAPLKVNSKKVVKKLNADLLDGKSAADFASSAPLVWKAIPIEVNSGWEICAAEELEAPQYAVRGDVVYLRGGVCDDVDNNATNSIGTLAAEARPERTVLGQNPGDAVAIPLLALTSVGAVRLNVFENGAVLTTDSSPDSISFEGLSFTR